MLTIKKNAHLNQIRIVFFIMLICSVAVTQFSCRSEQKDTNKEQPSDSLNQSNELKRKELELKERELELKEKELNEKKFERNEDHYLPGRFPEASERYLTTNEVASLSNYELKIMRNEIFARHGYIFKTEDMRGYFNNQSWYIPKYYDVNSFLSKIEKKNIELIKIYEK